jgi:hypothetical protein
MYAPSQIFRLFIINRILKKDILKLSPRSEHLGCEVEG